MDTYCPVCAEPWDVYELTVYAEEEGVRYADVRNTFAREGCGRAFSAWDVPCAPRAHAIGAERASIVTELMGDDYDGWDAMMSDMMLMENG